MNICQIGWFQVVLTGWQGDLANFAPVLAGAMVVPFSYGILSNAKSNLLFVLEPHGTLLLFLKPAGTFLFFASLRDFFFETCRKLGGAEVAAGQATWHLF